jgi:murein DD-endopeptidase MepM/ murein hydrolase activator NlpD
VRAGEAGAAAAAWNPRRVTHLRSCVLLACLALNLALLPAAPASARGRADVAALQVALRATGHYSGTIDGIRGPATRAATRSFQYRRGLVVDGIAGPATRRALGRRGRPRIGSRVIAGSARGWDVAALQFRLAWRGFPSGSIDGGFGARTEAALRRFQAWARLTADGAAGPATWRALRRPAPRSRLRFARPSAAPIGDRFGARGDRFHSGIDFVAGWNAPVRAAGRGCVLAATHTYGAYGRLVVIRHRRGMTSWYAHLNRIDVRPGECVTAGRRIGLVGSSGQSSGPHLHFELRVRDAVVNPLSGL